MQILYRTILILWFLFLLVILAASCESQGNLSDWMGEYSYSEEPIKAIAGYNMVMVWHLKIDSAGNGYLGTLEVNGQQTYFKTLVDVSGDRSSIALTYNKTIDGVIDRFEIGDTLFVLTKSKGALTTHWKLLEPRLAEESGRECTCFSASVAVNYGR